MKKFSFITLINQIGKLNLLFLLIWIIIFVLDKIFDIEIVERPLEEKFYLLLVPIVLLLIGILIFNLIVKTTKTGYSPGNLGQPVAAAGNNRGNLFLLIAFVVIIAGIFSWRAYDQHQTKKELVDSANGFLRSNKATFDNILNRSDNPESQNESHKDMAFMTQIDKNWQDIDIIVRDTLKGSVFYFEYFSRPDHEIPEINATTARASNTKIFKTDNRERRYFDEVFNTNKKEELYIKGESKHARDVLYIPYSTANRKAIIRFETSNNLR